MTNCLIINSDRNKFWHNDRPITAREFWELLPKYYWDDENGIYWERQPVQDAPKTHGGKKVVHVQHLDGTTEPDAAWWARQGELADYRQTVDDGSYRGQ